MKNKEKYFNEILEAFAIGGICEFKMTHIHKRENCIDISCTECTKKVKQWLEEEYKERIRLTKSEKAILESLDSMFKYITRDSACCLLSVHADKPIKKIDCWEHRLGRSHGLAVFNHLFQFIKWEDEEPYLISELLENCEISD